MKYISILILFFSTAMFAQAPPPATETINTNAPADVPPAETNTPPMEDPKIEATRTSNWMETLNYGISGQRLGVVRQIRQTKPSNMTTSLEEHFFKEGTLPVKEEIIYTFIESTNQNPTFWQKLFTDEKDITVLQRAAYAIEQMKAPNVGDQLYTRLSNESTNEKSIRFNANAVRALAELKYQQAIPLIVDVATNRELNQDYRGSAVLALGIFQDTAQMSLLADLATNTLEPRTLRRYAATGLGRLATPEAFEILAPIATNETEEQTVRAGAIAGIAYTESSNKLQVMEALSKSDNTTLRTEAVKALGRINNEESQTILKYKAFKDPEAIVRREARTALQSMGVDVDALEKEMRNNP
ncbi:MAG: HEAT repeat domain-containing protein [Brevinema sp.]